MNGLSWLAAIAIKLMVVVVFFVCVRLLAMAAWKILPDSRLKRALFATHGGVRSAWRSYTPKVRGNDADSHPALSDRKRGD